ncbi:inactive tyrosine-protein kinase PRAG1-like isoform X2 [Antennarius striatus]
MPFLFSSSDDQRAILRGLQHRHLLFLRSVMQSVAAGVLLQGDATQTDVYAPQDFLLCEGNEPKEIGDAVYYSLHSPKLPSRILGLRVHKQADGTPSAYPNQKTTHVYVQDVIAHIQPSKTSSSFKLETQFPSSALKPGFPTAKPPGGVSIECLTGDRRMNLTSIQSLLMNGHSLTVERDLPDATLEDFVQTSSSLQSVDCLNYDRQVCVLLLQILVGSQHLYISGSATELKPRKIFLVWPKRLKEQAGNMREQDTNRLKVDMECEKAEEKGKIQKLWRTHGSPRVVLTPLSSASTVPRPFTYMKSQIEGIIGYCLHSHESLTSLASGPTLPKSSYRKGLFYLASLLHCGKDMADMVAMLQVILWGPRPPLFDHRCLTTTTVHNWLTIKRALLVMKLAERGQIQDQSALDWEDCLWIQYLSSTDPEAILSLTRQLWLSLNAS